MAIKNPSIDPQVLREYFSYDPETGELVWRKAPGGKVKAGDHAGTVMPRGYRVVNFRGSRMQAHRLAWFLHYGEWPELILDHINRDPSDNRIENLRVVTNRQNQQNATRKGYYYYEKWGRYVAQIMHKGKSIYLGGHDTEEEAKAAYLKAKKELHPFYAGENPVTSQPVGTENIGISRGLKIRC